MEDRIGENAALLKGTFNYLNTEDVDDFQPLNTTSGQQFIEELIDKIGGIDSNMFGNIMSLISGSIKEGDAWSETLPWIKSLTKRRIGQLWIHHTGINEASGYGTDTKNWQLDTVMLMERNQGSQAGISFSLKFQKARNRTAETRQYYEPVSIEIVNSEWRSFKPLYNTVKLPPRETNALRMLQNLLAESGENRISMRDRPNVKACRLTAWRKFLK